MIELTIRGLQEAQQANLKLILALKPGGAVERGIRYAATQAHRHAVANTPHDTGALRASHRIKYSGGMKARIYIAGGRGNPRSKTPPREYGYYLHQQGMRPGLRSGTRAFYQATVERDGKKIAEGAIRRIIGELP